MDTLELLKVTLGFIEKIVGAVAWPGVVLASVLLFRKELLALMPTLKKLKLGILEGEFEREVKVVEARVVAEVIADQVIPPTTQTAEATTQPDTSPLVEPEPRPPPVTDLGSTDEPSPVENEVPSALIQPRSIHEAEKQAGISHPAASLINSQPDSAIVAAWDNIERAILSVISRKGLYIGERNVYSVPVWLATLEKEKAITLTEKSILEEMYFLRNKITHNQTYANPSAAQSYVGASKSLIRDLLTQLFKK
ncbi:hypothetical protein [Variovorax sp. tm]|uniref:hypothetical protein n=1 Tax=Variovorax atrisoli TaxID=3394203 RepID=UPI003A81089A